MLKAQTQIDKTLTIKQLICEHREYLNSPQRDCDREIESQDDRIADAAKSLRDKQLKKALQSAPKKMKFCDNDNKSWRLIVAGKTVDGRIVSFAKRAALIMESCVARGESIEECAKKCLELANNENISESKYGEAVLVLSKAQWIHAEELDYWYNKPPTQIKKEGKNKKENKHCSLLRPILR